jgi:hypothetical protein
VVVEKDDRDPCSAEDPLVEFGAEACQPVFVGNHNFCDISLLRGDQKPREAAPGVLETRAHVLVDCVVGVARLQRLDLTSKVVGLFAGRHPGVDSSVWLLLFLFFVFVGLDGRRFASFARRSKGIEVSDSIPAVAAFSCGGDHCALVGPLQEGGPADAEVPCGISGLEHRRWGGWFVGCFFLGWRQAASGFARVR